MAATLTTLLTAIKADPGLKANNPLAQLTLGYDASVTMNALLLKAIGATNANADGLLTAADMGLVAVETYANPADYVSFIEAHGNDNGDVTTGYHNIQNDGGTLVFQGHNFIDVVADAIYHFGFKIVNGRYVNEDGASNQTSSDVAGWLNYFLNGENVVFGSGAADELGSGTYSSYFAAARNETFMAGAGDDKIWADIGNDKVMAGDGNDRSGGGAGNDRLFGENGNDTLYGEGDQDAIYGGAGNDYLGGGTGNDTIDGGTHGDVIYGEVGNDLLIGGIGNDTIGGDVGADRLEGGVNDDQLSGGQGNDILLGELGNDKVSGGEGSDIIRGGFGADEISLWEQVQVRDAVFFSAGESGKSLTTIDHVDGFKSGIDKIYLTGAAGMQFEVLDYQGGGVKSCYYDGHYLRVDSTGDAVTDMIIEFRYLEALRATDFVFS